MQAPHWVMLAAIAALFYYVGAKYPQGLAKVGLS